MSFELFDFSYVFASIFVIIELTIIWVLPSSASGVKLFLVIFLHSVANIHYVWPVLPLLPYDSILYTSFNVVSVNNKLHLRSHFMFSLLDNSRRVRGWIKVKLIKKIALIWTEMRQERNKKNKYKKLINIVKNIKIMTLLMYVKVAKMHLYVLSVW